MTDRSPMTVAIRVRPLLSREEKEHEALMIKNSSTNTNSGQDIPISCVSVDSQNSIVTVEERRLAVDLRPYIDVRGVFPMDFAFDASARNLHVYLATVRQPLLDAIKTHNGRLAVFAFGQTGAGKTHTMLGSDSEHGLYALAVRDLLQYGSREFDLTFSLYEIYGDKTYDLLNDRATVRALEDEKQIVHLKGLTERVIGDEDDFLELMHQGSVLRSAGSTHANDRSSRSHAVALLNLCKKILPSSTSSNSPSPHHQHHRHKHHHNASATTDNVSSAAAAASSTSPNDNNNNENINTEISEKKSTTTAATTTKQPKRKVVSRFTFIDLAGSERGADTLGTHKERQHEGAAINQSLLAVKECVRALHSGHTHIPFRGSKLTQVLRDSLSGRCATVMLAMVSPFYKHVEDTVNALRYTTMLREVGSPAIMSPSSGNLLMSSGGAGGGQQQHQQHSRTFSGVSETGTSPVTSLGVSPQVKSLQINSLNNSPSHGANKSENVSNSNTAATTTTNNNPFPDIKCCEKCGYPIYDDENEMPHNCPKATVRCPHCQISVPKRGLDYHISQECPDVLVNCQFCNEEMKRSKISQHENGGGGSSENNNNNNENVGGCPKSFAICTQCNRKVQPRGALRQHMREDCPAAKWLCPFCKIVTARKNAEEHSATCAARLITCDSCGFRVRVGHLKQHKRVCVGTRRVEELIDSEVMSPKSASVAIAQNLMNQQNKVSPPPATHSRSSSLTSSILLKPIDEDIVSPQNALKSLKKNASSKSVSPPNSINKKNTTSPIITTSSKNKNSPLLDSKGSNSPPRKESFISTLSPQQHQHQHPYLLQQPNTNANGVVMNSKNKNNIGNNNKKAPSAATSSRLSHLKVPTNPAIHALLEQQTTTTNQKAAKISPKQLVHTHRFGVAAHPTTSKTARGTSSVAHSSINNSGNVSIKQTTTATKQISPKTARMLGQQQQQKSSSPSASSSSLPPIFTSPTTTHNVNNNVATTATVTPARQVATKILSPQSQYHQETTTLSSSRKRTTSSKKRTPPGAAAAVERKDSFPHQAINTPEHHQHHQQQHQQQQQQGGVRGFSPMQVTTCQFCHSHFLGESVLQQHIDNDCMAVTVPCPFADAGCNKLVKRQQLAQHLNQNLGQHLVLLHTKTQNVEAENAALRNRLNELAEETHHPHHHHHSHSYHEEEKESQQQQQQTSSSTPQTNISDNNKRNKNVNNNKTNNSFALRPNARSSHHNSADEERNIDEEVVALNKKSLDRKNDDSFPKNKKRTPPVALRNLKAGNLHEDDDEDENQYSRNSSRSASSASSSSSSSASNSSSSRSTSPTTSADSIQERRRPNKQHQQKSTTKTKTPTRSNLNQSRSELVRLDPEIPTTTTTSHQTSSASASPAQMHHHQAPSDTNSTSVTIVKNGGRESLNQNQQQPESPISAASTASPNREEVAGESSVRSIASSTNSQNNNSNNNDHNSSDLVIVKKMTSSSNLASSAIKTSAPRKIITVQDRWRG